MTAVNGDIGLGDEIIAVSKTRYDEALAKIMPQLGERVIYQYQLDGRYINSLQEHCTYLINNMTGIMQYSGIYFHTIADGIPSDFWKMNGTYLYLIYLEWGGHTGTVMHLNIPVDCSNFNRVYSHVRRGAGNSMGSAGILTFDGTLRNAKSYYYHVIERQELTEAQQISLLADIWNEIENGAGEDYNSTSTTTRVIDFQSTSSGRNDLVTETALVNAGWTKLSSTQYYRYILQNGVNKRRRVFINNT